MAPISFSVQAIDSASFRDTLPVHSRALSPMA
jgi:hypothetical protein